MAGISRESVLLISALLKCLIYAISENCSFGKALIKLLYLPNVFVFFINVDHFVIIEKGINLSQYRGTAGMFNNIFANKRCNKNSICYLRKIQSCEFGLTMIFFILLHAFPILIGFLKTISRKKYANSSYQQKIPDKLLLFVLVIQLLIPYLVISEIDAS